MVKNFLNSSPGKSSKKDTEQEVREKIIAEIQAQYDEFLKKHQSSPHLKDPETIALSPTPTTMPSQEGENIAETAPEATAKAPTSEAKLTEIAEGEEASHSHLPQETRIPDAYPEEAPAEPEVELSFEVGTILRLENGDVVVFKDSVPDSEYDVVYYLRPDGQLESRGVSLYSYQVEKIGKLPPEHLAEMERKMRWQRDVIFFHLDKLEYKHYIPGADKKYSSLDTAESSAVTKDDKSAAPKVSLQRGRKIIIKQGRNRWEGIYWGADSIGPMIAYQAGAKWLLTPLDLSKYRNSLEYGELLSAEEIKGIEETLR